MIIPNRFCLLCFLLSQKTLHAKETADTCCPYICQPLATATAGIVGRWLSKGAHSMPLSCSSFLGPFVSVRVEIRHGNTIQKIQNFSVKHCFLNVMGIGHYRSQEDSIPNAICKSPIFFLMGLHMGCTTGNAATVAHSTKKQTSGKDSLIEGQPLLLFM
jgi:hypothetical protein